MGRRLGLCYVFVKSTPRHCGHRMSQVTREACVPCCAEIVNLAARPAPSGGSGDGAAAKGLAALYAKPTPTLDEALLALRLLE